MKTALILLLGVLPFISMKGQDLIVKKKDNQSIVDIDTLVGIKNKKILFEYDTLFIINRYGVSEFVRCAKDLQRVKDLSGSLSSLSSDMMNIQTGVNDMHSNMKSMTDFINNYDKETKHKIEELETGNTELSKKMDLISKDLEEARQKIKAERWKAVVPQLLWGIGGFVAGSIIFTVVK
jgi:hypothetical protein